MREENEEKKIKLVNKINEIFKKTNMYILILNYSKA